MRWSVIPARILASHHRSTLLTAMFMHAGWLRLIGNIIFLRTFGAEVGNALNPVRFTVFYLASGAVAMAVQVAIDPGSTIPNLGANGAITAVIGAFLVTYPSDRVRTILFFG